MKPYILVVDDYPDGREILIDYLQFRGMTVVGATDGEEALSLASERAPAIVLMDLALPGIDGWEATRRLKADPRTKDVLVLAVSAHVMESHRVSALEAGADGFVVKPFDLPALADALTDILASGRPALEALHAGNLKLLDDRHEG